MTITTYAALESGVLDYLERSDLSAQAAGWIALAQAKLYRGVMAPDGRTWMIPPLRIRDMITTASIVVTAGVGTLPTGWLQFERLVGTTTDSTNLEYIPPTTYWDYESAYDTDTLLTGYTIEGNTIRTLPAGSDTLRSVHYAQFTAMSADSDHDWIVDNAPHVYLAGALAEAWNYIGGNLQEEVKQTAAFAAAISGLNAQNRLGQRSGAALIMRPRSIA